MRYVIIPGVGGSGPTHWQTLWEDAWGDRALRLDPVSWDEPELDDWCAALDRAVGAGGTDVVLIAHSLGCLAAAAWLTRAGRPQIRGAFLVAPPDVQAASFPAGQAKSFIAVDPLPLSVPALIVSSDDDPYCDPGAARRLAAAWQAGHISFDQAGHLNADSGLGMWPSGQSLLAAFLAGTGPDDS
ncbi:MAG: alpha/beta hydrolase [Catenulispora sp.]|nr:alpha/beta hydrolase [Catenulispora sp.]